MQGSITYYVFVGGWLSGELASRFNIAVVAVTFIGPCTSCGFFI